MVGWFRLSVVYFFSSRRRHTRLQGDWSSDVCSSDLMVSITPEGERLMTGLPGFKKSQEADGTFLYQAPLAQRQFVSIAGVTMVSANSATVDYNWKWVPNQLGDVFDAGGPMVKSFNTWERQTLINKYQVDFYNANPTKSNNR